MMVCNQLRGNLILNLQRPAAWKYWGIVSGIFLWIEPSQSQLKVKIVVRYSDHPKRCDTPSLRTASCWEVTHSKDLCWESSEWVLKVSHLENKSVGSKLAAQWIDWRRLRAYLICWLLLIRILSRNSIPARCKDIPGKEISFHRAYSPSVVNWGSEILWWLAIVLYANKDVLRDLNLAQCNSHFLARVAAKPDRLW